MKEIKICKSCGLVMQVKDDFGGGKLNNDYCKNCSDEFGYLKKYSEIIDKMKNFFMKQMAVSEEEAFEMASLNVSNIPSWIKKAQNLRDKKYILITDVGSTTTKAVLFEKSETSEFVLKAQKNVNTTVEKPEEDVKLGVIDVVNCLEDEIKVPLLDRKSSDLLKFQNNVMFLSTSSAGGGLQILVIGLTQKDSGLSAARAAFGAGGVILDVLAVDDKRTVLKQIQDMNLMHPDMILMSGGVDGGAIASVIRLGEILVHSEMKAKYNSNKIPLIFAGNIDAQDYIAGLFKDEFDLYFVPNIRPTIKRENLQPSRKKIHQLFMDHVMEQAPGYSDFKKLAVDDIIPTPLGFVNALEVISNEIDENIIAVDIGGATTDIFSNVMGSIFRTVSANIGMSFSAANILKEVGYESIKRWLPSEMDPDFVKNYIGNKLLKPTYNPDNDAFLIIEHAIAKEGIRNALQQHLAMCFDSENIGFLEKLKTNEMERLAEKFSFKIDKQEKTFHDYQINVYIGAGGVISHAKSEKQALMILYEGFNPKGISEIWWDKRFVSPHLGKLANLDEKLALKLLQKYAYEKLAIVIRPVSKKWKEDEKILSVKIGHHKEDISVGQLRYFENSKKGRSIKIILESGYYLNGEQRKFSFTTDLPLLIDCRKERDFDSVQKVLELYDENQLKKYDFSFNPNTNADFDCRKGDFIHSITLPYKGEIFVKKGDYVKCDTIVGENKYEPPKIYVLSMFDKPFLGLDSNNFEECLLIKEGDVIKYGQRIVERGKHSLVEEIKGHYHYFDSPVRGVVERINYEAGAIIIREVQNYSLKPIKINIAKKLNVKPGVIARYMKKNEKEFVYAGEAIASIIVDVGGDRRPNIVTAPQSGWITGIDYDRGVVTIQYKLKPFKMDSGVVGVVDSVIENHGARIRYKGYELKGKIGFGRSGYGKIKIVSNSGGLSSDCSGKIIISKDVVTSKFLFRACEFNVSGVVAPSVSYSDVADFIGKDIGVAITGNEEIPFPLILTEGFGSFKMSNELSILVSDNEDRLMYISGKTQIRAGIIRPKIIIMYE